MIKRKISVCLFILCLLSACVHQSTETTTPEKWMELRDKLKNALVSNGQAYDQLIVQEKKKKNVSQDIIQATNNMILILKELEAHYKQSPIKDDNNQKEIDRFRTMREIKEKELFMRTN